MCYVVRNFLLWKRGEKHTKNLPLETEEKRKKTPDHTKRGNSNVLAHSPIIRVLTVVEFGHEFPGEDQIELTPVPSQQDIAPLLEGCG